MSKAKLAAGVVSADDDGSLALGTAGVTTDHEADGLGLAQGTFAESALCRRLLTSALYGENGIGSEWFLSRVTDNFFCVRTLLPLGSNWRYLWRVTLNGSPCLRVLFTSFDLWRVA